MSKQCLQAALGLMVMVVGLGVTSARANPTQPPENVLANLPANLHVPKGQQLSFKSFAQGDQIYICQASAENPNTYAWTLKAPRADLFDRQGGKPLGTHYGGPTWEAQDKSKIVGMVSSRANAPDSNAIPWLLLAVKDHQGQGVFSPINWIQRVNTVGGKAPSQPCDAGQLNREVRVPYTAEYYFYQTAMNVGS
jgi:hypothetical protein